jgi:hypothetical protein
MDDDMKNKRLVCRKSWIPVAYQDVGDNCYFHEGFELFEEVVSLLFDLQINGASGEKLAPALAACPDFIGIKDDWDNGPPLGCIRDFDDVFDEGKASDWFLTVRGGYENEILLDDYARGDDAEDDEDEEGEEPTTDRLFVSLTRCPEVSEKFRNFAEELRKVSAHR